MDGSTLAGLRIERFLETEPVIWLSTTRETAHRISSRRGLPGTANGS
jgi:hypothetical protein